MNTAQLLAQVKSDANANQAQVIINALDNLSRSLDRAKERIDALPENAPTKMRAQLQYEYEQAVKAYTQTRVLLHHTYKWLRDGQDYEGREIYTDYKTRSNIKSRYFDLWDKSEELRFKKNQLLQQLDPDELKKHVKIDGSSRKHTIKHPHCTK